MKCNKAVENTYCKFPQQKEMHQISIFMFDKQKT